MRVGKDRGATGLEYVAMLLVAAVLICAVAVSIKPEWVQQKVCLAVSAITGEGRCAAAKKPPAEVPPKPCEVLSNDGSSTVHIKGGIKVVQGGGEGGYGTRMIEYSDGSADIEVYYDVAGELGAEFGAKGNGKVGAKASVAAGGKYTNTETYHFDKADAARAARGQLNDYAEDRALAKLHAGADPDSPNIQLSETSRTQEYSVKAEGEAGLNRQGSAYKSTTLGGSGSLEGKLEKTDKVDRKTGDKTVTVKTEGSAEAEGHANVSLGASGSGSQQEEGVPHASLGGHAGADADTSVSVTRDKSGKLTEVVITRSVAVGAGTDASIGDGETGKGKYKPKHASTTKPKPPRDPNYKPRHGKDPEPEETSVSGEAKGDGKGRKTTTIRIVVNDSNRDKVENWIGSKDIGIEDAPDLLWRAAQVDPLDPDKDDDFGKFLNQSEDVQIDEQKALETSASDDNSIDAIVFEAGIKTDTNTNASTGQTAYFLQDGKRVAKRVESCR